MKQVTVLAALSAPADLFDEATADIETFGGINYLIVRRADPSNERVNRELLAAFSTFHSFRIDDTEGSPELAATRAQVEYLHTVIAEANKEVLERDQKITELNKDVAALINNIEELEEKQDVQSISPPHLELPTLQAPRQPMEALPVAIPQDGWVRPAENVAASADDYVPMKDDEEYACEPDNTQLAKEQAPCHDSSATKAPPKGKKC